MRPRLRQARGRGERGGDGGGGGGRLEGNAVAVVVVVELCNRSASDEFWGSLLLIAFYRVTHLVDGNLLLT